MPKPKRIADPAATIQIVNDSVQRTKDQSEAAFLQNQIAALKQKVDANISQLLPVRSLMKKINKTLIGSKKMEQPLDIQAAHNALQGSLEKHLRQYCRPGETIYLVDYLRNTLESNLPDLSERELELILLKVFGFLTVKQLQDFQDAIRKLVEAVADKELKKRNLPDPEKDLEEEYFTYCQEYYDRMGGRPDVIEDHSYSRFILSKR